MGYDLAGIEVGPEEFLATLNESAAGLMISESIAVYTLEHSLSTRNEGVQQRLELAKTVAREDWDKVTEGILGETEDYFDRENRLRKIYQEVAEARIELLLERFPRLGEEDLKRQCQLDRYAGTILKHLKTRRSIIKTLNNNYTFELNRNFRYVTELYNDNPSASDLSLYKRAAVLGAAGLVLAGGYAARSKFKNR